MILNWALLKHPMNWVVVTLMVLIAGIALHFFAQLPVGTNPLTTATGKKST